VKRVYLITGASGFVGSCLLRHLVENKEDVHIILRKEAQVWRIKDILKKTKVHCSDLTSFQELKKIFFKAKPTVIYHLAAYGAYPEQTDSDLAFKVNLSGTWNILKAASCIDYELLVNTGSSSEYGFKDKPMREDDCLEPTSYYAVSKSSASLLCSYFARKEKKPVVTLRPFSVYGAYEQPSRFVPTLMRCLYFKKAMDLVNPDIARDYIYVDDMVSAYMNISRLKLFPGEIFNIATGKQSSIKDIVEKAVKVTGKTTSFRWGKMPMRQWDTSCWVADISKAKKLLGFKPQVSLEKGLSLTWEWFKRNHSIYK
jgi:nucleoside-diphosphate-sugar epimerase